MEEGKFDSANVDLVDAAKGDTESKVKCARRDRNEAEAYS